MQSMSISDEENNTTKMKENHVRSNAEQVIKIFIPVMLCMMFVVSTVATVNFFNIKDVFFIYTPFNEQSPNVLTKVWKATANSFIFLSVIILVTIIVMILYRSRCYKIIHGWLLISSFTSLFIVSHIYLHVVLKVYNIPVDWITLLVTIWNFGFMGMISIHWKGPLFLQQAYLIFVSALVALFLIKFMPDWTTWVLLVLMSVWDLFAVLTPMGPLRSLVRLAAKRKECPFPAMIYSSTVTHMTVTPENQNAEQNQSQRLRNSHTRSLSDSCIGNLQSNQRENVHRSHVSLEDVELQASAAHPPLLNRNINEEIGVRLGLGDFVFYSVLVGKASSFGDWNTTLACFVAVLVGLCVTLFILKTGEKALPALPVSIMLGLLFCFTTRTFVKPFIEALSVELVFI